MATYISLDNLARYDMKAKARAESLYADASAACWQKTEKAGAVTCVPAPETPLEPVVEFLFKETLPSGTKGPGNPSTITGVSSVSIVRTGKNLCPDTGWVSGQYTNDGVYGQNNARKMSPFIAIKPNTSYAMSIDQSETKNLAWINYNYFDKDKKWLGSRTTNGESSFSGERTHVFSISDSDAAYVRLVARAYSDSTLSIDSVNIADATPQLEEGNAVTAYEVFGADYAITLPSTFYGGTLDVASGRLTVTHRMVEPSSGTVDISDRPALLPLEFTDTYGRTVTSADGTSLSVGSSGGQIVYRLANPYTVQIDPTPIDSLPALGRTSPRVNTVYTDALNVQVGYAEHPAYTEQQINNAILALGGNV